MSSKENHEKDNVRSDIQLSGGGELSQSGEIIKTIPVFGEKFTVTKTTEHEELKLEKKWITSTKKIEIPVKYEEIYINGKELDSYNRNEILEVFSKFRDKISGIFLRDLHTKETSTIDDKHSFNKLDVIQYKTLPEKMDRNVLGEKQIPLPPYPSENDETGPKNNENVIAIWGEEIIINKRMVKLGEIIIKKYEAHEKRKVNVHLNSEKLKIKYPNSQSEEIM